jgi:hypothetical protein
MGIYPSRRQQGKDKDKHCIHYHLEEARISSRPTFVLWGESWHPHLCLSLFDREFWVSTQCVQLYLLAEDHRCCFGHHSSDVLSRNSKHRYVYTLTSYCMLRNAVKLWISSCCWSNFRHRPNCGWKMIHCTVVAEYRTIDDVVGKQVGKRLFLASHLEHNRCCWERSAVRKRAFYWESSGAKRMLLGNKYVKDRYLWVIWNITEFSSCLYCTQRNLKLS